MKQKTISWFVIFAIFISLMQGVLAEEENDIANYNINHENNASYETGEMIVQYTSISQFSDEDSAENQFQIALNNTSEVEIENTIEDEDGNNISLIKLDKNINIENAINDIKNLPNVKHVEPNYKIYASDIELDSNAQWGLYNQDGYDINIQGVWDKHYENKDINSEVVVAVLDTGIDIYHPDLEDNIYINSKENFGSEGVDDDNNGFVDDNVGWNFCNQNNIVYDNRLDSYGENEDNHGTHVAGIIAASQNNFGIQGVAYDNVKILPIKFIAGKDGGTMFDAIKGIDYAERMGADIINCSWGSLEYSYLLQDTIDKSKMLFVCSAGNESEHIVKYVPSVLSIDNENVLAVAALNRNGQFAEFSNYGGMDIIAAPGVDIYSTLPNNQYGVMSGTSMAAPFVTGVAALMKSSNYDISAGDIKKYILNNNIVSDDTELYRGKLDSSAAYNCVDVLNAYQIKGSELYGGNTYILQNQLYQIGGYNSNGYMKDVMKYNIENNNWEKQETLNRKCLFSGLAKNNQTQKTYQIGGRDSENEYNNIWEIGTQENQSVLPENLSGMAVSQKNNDFYLLGGVSNKEYQNSVYKGNSKITSMPENRGYGCAEVVGDYMYVFGGSNEEGCVMSTYKCNLKTLIWEECASTEFPHNKAESIVKNGKIYVFGGSSQYTEDGHDTIVENGELAIDTPNNIVEEYDIDTNTWTRVMDMNIARSGFSIVEFKNHVLLCGGWNGKFLSEIEVYNAFETPRNIHSYYNEIEDAIYVKWNKVIDADGYDIEINGEIFHVNDLQYQVPDYTNNSTYRIRATIGSNAASWSEYYSIEALGKSMNNPYIIHYNIAKNNYVESAQQEIWYKFETKNIDDVNIILSDIPTNCTYALELYDRYGKFISKGVYDDNVSTISNILLTNSVYYIKVYSESGVDANHQFSIEILQNSSENDSDLPCRVTANKVSYRLATIENNYTIWREEDHSGPSISLDEIPNNDINTNGMEVDIEIKGKLKSKNDVIRYNYTATADMKLTAVIKPPAGHTYYAFFGYERNEDVYSGMSSSQAWNNIERIAVSNKLVKKGQKYQISVIGNQGDYDSQNDFTLRIFGTVLPDEYEANQLVTDADDDFYGNHSKNNFNKFANTIGSNTKAVDGLNMNFDCYNDIDTYPISIEAGDKISACLELDNDEDPVDYGINFIWEQSIKKVSEVSNGIAFHSESYKQQSYEPATSLNTKQDKKIIYSTWIVPDDYDTKENKNAYIKIGKKRLSMNSGKHLEYKFTVTKVKQSEYQNDSNEISEEGYSNDLVQVGQDITATQIIGQTASGEIDNQLDVDWYKYRNKDDQPKNVILNGNPNLGMALMYDGKIMSIDGSSLNVLEAHKLYNIGIYAKDGKYGEMINDSEYTINIEDYSVPTLKFNSSSGNEGFIFDDNPEFIRRCDILDDGTFAPSALTHKYRLGPGVYNVFSYHHVSNETVGDGYSPAALNFPNNTKVYFDAVFSNASGNAGNIKIKRLGCRSFEKDRWECNPKAYEDYQQGISNPEERYISDDALWLSDIMGTKQINDPDRPENGTSEGIVHMLMEFEVTGGEVDFSTVAYKDKTNAKMAFGSNTPDDIKSIYEHSKALKGFANESQTKVADEMTYIIDNNTKGLLKANIQNQFYDSLITDAFVTHCSPWEQVDNFVGSSAVNLKFDGKAVIERDGTTGEATEYSDEKEWYLDSLHSRFFEPHSVPNDAKFGKYTNKSLFSANEKFDEQWMKDTIKKYGTDKSNDERYAFFNKFNTYQDNDGLSISFTGYGITYQIPVRIYNNSDSERTFIYKVTAGDFNIYASAEDDDGEQMQVEYSQIARIIDKFAKITLPPQRWVNITLNSRLLTGSDGIMVHRFLIE